MGRSRTCNYQVQSEECPGKVLLEGSMSIKEAIERLLSTCKHYGLSRGYIWPQTGVGMRLFENRYNSNDYLIVDNITFAGSKTSYTLKPRKVGE